MTAANSDSKAVVQTMTSVVPCRCDYGEVNITRHIKNTKTIEKCNYVRKYMKNLPLREYSYQSGLSTSNSSVYSLKLGL